MIKYNHGDGVGFEPISQAVISGLNLALESVKIGLGIKGNQKNQIQNLMYEFVTMNNYSLRDMIDMAPSLYKQNKKYFVEQYNLAASRRGLKNQNSSLINLIVIVAVIALVIYYVATKK